jgi:hypothetical protein
MKWATFLWENPEKLPRKKSAKSVPGKNTRTGKA